MGGVNGRCEWGSFCLTRRSLEASSTAAPITADAPTDRRTGPVQNQARLGGVRSLRVG